MNYQPILHVVLYQPEIPQNTGNIGRTCVAVGAKLWLVRPLGFRVDDHNLTRSGLDYWQHLQWEAVDDWACLQQTISVADDHSPSPTTWLFSKHATRSYTEADYAAGDVLAFGPETSGLPNSLLQSAGDKALRIPMRPAARSLNLANAVAVAAYEALRQIQSP